MRPVSKTSAQHTRSNRLPGHRRPISPRPSSALAVLLFLLAFAAAARAADVKVGMTDSPPRFVPEKVTIKVGQTVEWNNNAATLHTVTAKPEAAINKADVSLPAGAQPFDSGFMPPGQSFSYTFAVPGTYRYFCIPHESLGMVGEVVVRPK